MSTLVSTNIQVGSDSTATNNFTIYQPSTPDGTLRIGNGNSGSATSRVTLDSAGNLGLGVTPSAFSAGYPALQFGGNPVIASQNNLALAGNAYYNSGWKYIASNFASRYDSNFNNGGIHAWFTAPSGTAGNAISFGDPKMTLDVSGNLIVGGTTGLVTAANRGNITINGSTSSLVALGVSNTATASFYADATVVNLSARTNIPLLLSTNDTERARITSGGKWKVGTTADGSYPSAMETLSSDSGTTNWNVGPYSTATNFLISSGTGGVQLVGTATSWSALSDERLKTDIAPIENAAQKVASLRAVTGRYKTDATDVSRAFLIAQDVQAVLPEAVNSSKIFDGDDTEYLGVQYTDTIPLLVAAIKEQQALITDLRARVAALEA